MFSLNDKALNDRLNAISGKLDRVLTRQLENEEKTHDILAKLSVVQRRLQLLQTSGFTGRCLGKKPPKIDKRTLKFSKYLKSNLPAPAEAVDWSSGVTKWGMMLNDQLGDCTIAGCGHAVQGWSAANAHELTLPDWVILDYYEVWNGYVPGNPSTDQGGVEIDVLNYWRKYGFGYRKNHKGANGLYAYADPNPRDVTHVKQAISLFGGVYIGLALPLTAQSQTIWSVVGNPDSDPDSVPGSWGGHAVWVCKYDTDYLTCITWGGLMKMTWKFWKAYCDESHALLSTDWIGLGKAPDGFDLATLETDLTQVTA